MEGVGILLRSSDRRGLPVERERDKCGVGLCVTVFSA